MDINQLGGKNSFDPKPEGNSALGKDQFVKLLMAQLSHQDPLSPMDSQAFVAQLAQFANVEQLQSANARLESILVASAANNQTTVASLVGKDVRFLTDSVGLEAGTPTTFSADLKGTAAQVTATITDASGKVVRTLQVGGHDAGRFDITWDGLDDAGNPLPTGEYSVRVAAADTEGKSVEVVMQATGRITGVNFEKGYPELMVGLLKLKMSNVVEVLEGSA